MNTINCSLTLTRQYCDSRLSFNRTNKEVALRILAFSLEQTFQEIKTETFQHQTRSWLKITPLKKFMELIINATQLLKLIMIKPRLFKIQKSICQAVFKTTIKANFCKDVTKKRKTSQS